MYRINRIFPDTLLEIGTGSYRGSITASKAFVCFYEDEPLEDWGITFELIDVDNGAKKHTSLLEALSLPVFGNFLYDNKYHMMRVSEIEYKLANSLEFIGTKSASLKENSDFLKDLQCFGVADGFPIDFNDFLRYSYLFKADIHNTESVYYMVAREGIHYLTLLTYIIYAFSGNYNARSIVYLSFSTGRLYVMYEASKKIGFGLDDLKYMFYEFEILDEAFISKLALSCQTKPVPFVGERNV